MGLLWFLATVASTLPLIPARDVMAADRYVYLPNVGLFWLTAVALVHVVVWAGRRSGGRMVGYVAGAVGVVAAVPVLIYTWHVESYYASNLAKASRIAALYPDVPGVWEDVGWAHYRSGARYDFEGDHDKALEAYASAIRTGEKDLERHPEELACEIYQLQAMAQYRMGQVDEAIETLHRAIDADPDYGKCYSRLGQILYEIGRYAEAEPNFLRAVEIMPDYLPAVQALGHVYRKLGRLEEAKQQYLRGLEINDCDPISTTALGELEMQRGDYVSATSRFERLLGWMPENIVARTNLGVCYASAGRPEDAKRSYRAVLDRDPTAVTAAVNLAALESQSGGGGAAALDVLGRALSQRPGDRRLLASAHDVLAGLGRLREAAQLWANGLDREPRAADLRAWYAWTSALAGQWLPAVQEAEISLAGDSGQSLALAALVLADLARGDPEAADGRLDRFLDSRPNPADARLRLRGALEAIGMRKLDDPWPYYFMARLLLADGDAVRARAGVEEFVRLCPDAAWRERARAMLGSGGAQ